MGQRRRIVPIATRGVVLLFIVALPLFLLTSNLRLAFNGVWLYTYGFERYDISQATGIPEGELRRVAEEIVTYWNSDAERLDARVFEAPLYNEREVIHLRDVKGLVRGVFRIQEVTGALLLAYILGGFLVAKTGFLVPLAKRIRAGGLLTLALLLVSGIALAVAFPWLFYLFHLVSFNNDFWQLDPRRDFLIRMFPEGFWYLATMLVVLLTVAEALALVLGAWLGLRRLRNWRGRMLEARVEVGETGEGVELAAGD